MDENAVTKKDLKNAKEEIEKELIQKIGKLKYAREQDLEALRVERREDMDKIMQLLEPIAETYRTASTMGKWVMAGMVFISVGLGILLSFRSLFK